MHISGIVKSSFVDYPGLVSCVLFVSGCNYNCFYCHNRHLLEGRQEIIHSEWIDDFLHKRVGLLDAVVISGGEPTLQKDLIPFAKRIKHLGYQIKLDTNGCSPTVIEELLKSDLFDYYAVDYKAPSSRYKEICGNSADAATVLHTINLLLRAEVAFEVRTTVIPQLKEADLFQMAKELPTLPRYALNPYRKPEYSLPCDLSRIKQTPYTKNQIALFAKKMQHLQPNIMI